MTKTEAAEILEKSRRVRKWVEESDNALEMGVRALRESESQSHTSEGSKIDPTKPGREDGASGEVRATAMQIERVIRRIGDRSDAEFFLKTVIGDWWACSAWIEPDGKEEVMVRGKIMPIDKVSSVCTAIQMAIEWIAEERERRESR